MEMYEGARCERYQSSRIWVLEVEEWGMGEREEGKGDMMGRLGGLGEFVWKGDARVIGRRFQSLLVRGYAGVLECVDRVSV